MRRAARVAGVFVVLAACRGEPTPPAGPPKRDCALTIWHQASSTAARVEIVGDFNGWARPGRILPADRADGWRVTSIDVPPGEHTYAIVEDGTWIVDPRVATSAFHDGQEVSWVEVPSCAEPALRIDAVRATPDGAATIEASFLAASAGAALDRASLRVTDRAGSDVPARVDADANAGHATLRVTGLSPGKHRLTVRARDDRGGAAEAFATAWVEPRAFDTRDLVIYQVIVDRYRNAAGPLAPPAIASARAGGTLAGVRAAIEAGEISRLGANALWLSPLYKNPDGVFAGDDGRTYSSYHGYWPIAPRTLEDKLGAEADLDALVASAHARGIRVLFDVVPNHVHEQHPYVKDHPGWVNHRASDCVCGQGSCDWGGHIQDCWFAPYMPDMDWRDADAARTLADDVAWWIDRFDGDGIRIDAVPMMPRAATRRMAWLLRNRYDHAGNETFILGENFTGPGGYSILRYQLGPYGLDSEFDFPLMWSVRGALGDGTQPLSAIDEAVRAGADAWSGSGAVMGSMIGNHDVTRFASVANGDADGDGWTPAAAPKDALVYAKQSMALATILTLPGVPVVYYGDEIALPGRRDPDSRRVMPAESELTDAQRGVRDVVSRVATARACSDALRRGGYRALSMEPERVVFAREIEGGEPIVVAISRNPPAGFEGPLPGIPAGSYVDLLTGQETSLIPELTKWARAPFSVQIYFPKASPCLPRK